MTPFFATRVTYLGDSPQPRSAKGDCTPSCKRRSCPREGRIAGVSSRDILHQHKIAEIRKLLRQSSNKRARAYWARELARLESGR